MATVNEILSALETADNNTKNKLENMIVNQGSAVVPELVRELQNVRGIKRGVVAMSLIRIGKPAVEVLNKTASVNKDFEWIAKYLISEINSCVAA